MLKEFLKMTDWSYEIRNVFRSSASKNKRKFMKNFLERNDRFIHISAHGIDNGLSLEDPNETEITIDDIDAYAKKTTKRKQILEHKFVTLSVCGQISNGFTVRLHDITSVTAVISPLAPVSFAESALFSVLFYFSLSQSPKLSNRSMPKTDASDIRTPGRIAQYIDAYQRTKISYLGIGGTGAHRLDYWWENEHVIVN